MQARKFLEQTNSKDTKTFRHQGQQAGFHQEQDYASKAQEAICSFFLANMKKKSPEWVLQQFDNLFISKTELLQSPIHQALYVIVSLNQEQIFRETLKRCCYILINNWTAARNHQHIQQLIQLFLQASENELNAQTSGRKHASEGAKMPPKADVENLSRTSRMENSPFPPEGRFTQAPVRARFQPSPGKDLASAQKLRSQQNLNHSPRRGNSEGSPPPLSQNTLFQTKQRLDKWLQNFLGSEDYQELNLFFSKYNRDKSPPWSNRYASYLLTSQVSDLKKPKEQRDAARVVSQQLKEQFKFDLAMYTTRSQMAVASVKRYKNPTVLGDDVLILIKKLLVKSRKFSYVSLANIFLKQTEGILYKHFKSSLLRYLRFDLEEYELLDVLKPYISEYIERLYEDHNEEVLTPHLRLKTCNRVVDFLTTINRGQPSQVFTLLALQGESFMLAILLLKIIMICQSSYLHLESCIAYLIQYYDDVPESECEWLIIFLETIRITLTLYAENIRYTLLKINPKQPKKQQIDNSNSYRIFSQVKLEG